MAVELSELAAREIHTIMEQQSLDEEKTFLRVGVKGGGCSGLSYVLDFTEEREGDTVMEFEGFRVYLDRKSTIYLSGITLDHQSGLEGKGFVFQNPAATNTCGCGESFSL